MAEPLQESDQDATALLDELRAQLAEQRTSLEGIVAALVLEPSDEALLQIREQLEEGIAHMEQALSELQGGVQQEDEQQQEQHWRDSDSVPDMQQGQPSTSSFTAGDVCRFRYMDGRWYRGVVMAVHAATADVAFAVPTKPFMLHHVHQIPLALVERAAIIQQPEWQPGARLLAKPPWAQLWAPAEVVSVDQRAGTATVVFPAGGRTAQLQLHQLAGSPYDDGDVGAAEDRGSAGSEGGAAPAAGLSGRSTDEGEGASDGWSDDGSDDGDTGSEQEPDGLDGAGFAAVAFGLQHASAVEHARLAAEAGAQTSSALFAQWELHTRGIASKLMADMGFVSGRGLGRQGAGQVAPLEVTLLPLRRGLGGSEGHGAADNMKKRSKKRRGGERSRRKRHKAAAAEAKQQRRNAQHQLEVKTGEVGLFAFINNELGDGSEAAQKLYEAGLGKGGSSLFGDGAGGSTSGRQGATATGAAHKGASKPPDRRGLLQQQDRVAAAQDKVQKLTAMLARNTSNKPLAVQIKQKLVKAKADVEHARSELAAMSNAINKGEAQRSMFKF